MLQRLQTMSASLFLQAHWKLSGSPIKRPYLGAVDLYEKAKDQISYSAWRAYPRRPHLNADSVHRLLKIDDRKPGHAGSADPEKTAIIDGRLVAHITFHLKRSRIPYVIETAEQIRRLPFESTTIVLETNSPETIELMQQLQPKLFDRIIVHSRLSHPFRLAWAHRESMRQELDQFDYFLSIEDDIALTPESIRLWHESRPVLARHGLLPGFLRVEMNRAGQLISSDFSSPATRDDIVEIEGKPYLLSPYPYQAFWIYDKREISEFVASEIYEQGYSFLFVRESAAAGYMYRREGETFHPRHLLPLTPSLEIDPRCFCFHMPSNYGKRILPHPARIGTLPIDRLIAPL